MMKIKIEGIELHYKNVADLNTKVHENLVEVKAQRLQAASQLKALTKKERALMRFLGLQKPELQPDTIQSQPIYK